MSGAKLGARLLLLLLLAPQLSAITQAQEINPIPVTTDVGSKPPPRAEGPYLVYNCSGLVEVNVSSSITDGRDRIVIVVYVDDKPYKLECILVENKTIDTGEAGASIAGIAGKPGEAGNRTEETKTTVTATPEALNTVKETMTKTTTPARTTINTQTKTTGLVEQTGESGAREDFKPETQPGLDRDRLAYTLMGGILLALLSVAVWRIISG